MVTMQEWCKQLSTLTNKLGRISLCMTEIHANMQVYLLLYDYRLTAAYQAQKNHKGRGKVKLKEKME